MDTELQPISRNGNDGASCSSNVTAGNGDGVAYGTSEATEGDRLLSVQVNGNNGEAGLSSHTAEAQRNPGNTLTPQETGSIHRIRRELQEKVCWKVRLWMVIAFIFLLIIVVIIISLAVCSAIHEDVDEKFDSSLFKVPRYFNGSFQLPSLIFTEDLLDFSSNKSQEYTADLQKKMADIYTYSPALGRYFSKAEIHAFRNGSVVANYQLTFLMPEEQQDELKKFTLSREMVYNVFRQFLYDQEPQSSGLMYIDPLSLKMF
ncbi:TPA-induced transmembrane protein homolog isoform X2 [Toxotes jaculatrix]|uniref:TPA-induced transmembrane protein homolog isoform X2 n=1 Tax=Toxotes jaculatrix TaxID=941984 RepID=UPI001B3B01E8|nr:TPA-induced transmembrane protein homolog isoform X2 [Toxotes jaculatrix]